MGLRTSRSFATGPGRPSLQPPPRKGLVRVNVYMCVYMGMRIHAYMHARRHIVRSITTWLTSFGSRLDWPKDLSASLKRRGLGWLLGQPPSAVFALLKPKTPRCLVRCSPADHRTHHAELCRPPTFAPRHTCIGATRSHAQFDGCLGSLTHTLVECVWWLAGIHFERHGLARPQAAAAAAAGESPRAVAFVTRTGQGRSRACGQRRCQRVTKHSRRRCRRMAIRSTRSTR